MTKPTCPTQLYGVYSSKQETVCGSVEYATPGGGTVIVTEVDSIRGRPGSLWDDKVDVGPVTRFVREITYSRFIVGHD